MIYNDKTDRRTLLAGTFVASLATLAAATGAFAQTKRPLSRKQAEPAGPYQAVVDAAKICITRGEVCRAHCIRKIKSGDTSLEACLKLVNAMLPVCQATGRLAANDAARFKDLAKVCRDVCTDCQAECKKHADHHAECKGCYDACTTMISALKSLPGV